MDEPEEDKLTEEELNNDMLREYHQEQKKFKVRLRQSNVQL